MKTGTHTQVPVPVTNLIPHNKVKGAVCSDGSFGPGPLHENRSDIAAAPTKDESMSQNILTLT